MAQIVAVNHPQMVSGLLLTNAISYDSWPVPLVDAVAKTGSIAKHAPDGSFHKLLEMMFSKGHETEAAAKAAYDAHAPHYEAHGEAEAFVRQAQSLDVEDTKAIADQLPGLSMPARNVRGAADEFQKLDYGERLSQERKSPLHSTAGAKPSTPTAPRGGGAGARGGRWAWGACGGGGGGAPAGWRGGGERPCGRGVGACRAPGGWARAVCQGSGHLPCARGVSTCRVPGA